jgi:hypothetical protein
MIKNITIILLPLFIAFGCATTKNVIITDQNDDIEIYAKEDGSLLICLPTPTIDWEKKGIIISNLSYAIDSDGKKYNLTGEPFEIAHASPKPTNYTSDFVWLVAAKNHSKMEWYNSVWLIHLVLRSDRGDDIFDTTFELNDR